MSPKLGTFLLCLVAVFVFLFARFTDAQPTNPASSLLLTTESTAASSVPSTTEREETTAVTTAPSSESVTTTEAPLVTEAPQSSSVTIEDAPSSTEEDLTPPETTDEVTDSAPAVSTEPSVTTPPTSDETGERKLVAFTFDDGPHATFTYLFVDKLKEYGGTATFFVVGNRVNAATGAALRYAYDNGCEIGLHSWRHTYYANMTVEEFLADTQKAADAVNAYLPEDVTLLRPPGGRITADKREAAPYAIVLWSVDPSDYLYRDRTSEAEAEANIETIVDTVLSRVEPGDIVLMHEIYRNSYEAFCRIIEELSAKGYEFVTVSELLGETQNGQIYRHS